MNDTIFLPCEYCEFFNRPVECNIDKRNLYTDPLLNQHCNNFLYKGLYAEDDVECILKELQAETKCSSYKKYYN